jgi:mono/diheme cytochrome c family protein
MVANEFHFLRLEPLLAMLVLFPLGCASLPRASSEDLARAKTHYPDATLASLEAGRRAFADSCAGCHALPRPESKSAEEWPKVLDEMATEARLNSKQKDLIAQFLTAMSRRSPSAQLQRR